MKLRFVLLYATLLCTTAPVFGQTKISIFDNLDSLSQVLYRTAKATSFTNADSIQVNSLVDSIKAEYRDFEGLDSLITAIEHFRASYNLAHRGVQEGNAQMEKLPQLLLSSADYLKQFDSVTYSLDSTGIVTAFSPEDINFTKPINSQGLLMNDYYTTALAYSGRSLATVYGDDLDLLSSTMRSTMRWKCCKIKVRVKITVRNPIPSKPLESLSDAVKGASNVISNVIPENVKTEATKFLGSAVVFAGNTIQLVRENGEKISDLSQQGLEVYKAITEATNDQVIRLKDGLLNATGVTLPSDVNNLFDQYLSINEVGIKQLYKAYDASLNLTFSGMDLTSTMLKEFGHYLLLSANGFPKELNGELLNKRDGIALAELDPELINLFIIRAFEENLKLSQSDNAVTLVSFGKGTIRYDESTHTIVVELTDSKVRQNMDFGLPRISGTINVKKIKMQIVVSQNSQGLLTLSPNLYYLDVEDLLPKFDEMLCYALREKVMKGKSVTVDAKKLLNTTIKVKGSDLEKVTLNIDHLNPSFYFSKSSFGLTIAGNKVSENSQLSKASNNPVEVSFTSQFVKSTINQTLQSTNGIKMNFKAQKKFSSDESHYHVRNVKSITFASDGAMIINTQASAHLRKFLGKKPKLNLIFENVSFKVIPELRTTNDTLVLMNVSITPILDSIRLRNAPIRSAILRKGLRLFKKSSMPIELKPIDISGITKVRIDNPINPSQNILQGKIKPYFTRKEDLWTFSVSID